MTEVDQLKARVGDLERRLDDFLLRVKVLNWFAGILCSMLAVILSIFGFSYKGIVAQVAQEILKQSTTQVTSNIDDHVKKAQEADASLEKEIEAAQHGMGQQAGGNGVGHDNAQGHGGHEITHGSAVKYSRTQRQIDAMKGSLAQQLNPNFVYDEKAMIHDYGMLSNCVTVFIVEMHENLQANGTAPNYAQSNASEIYQQILDLASQLQGRVQSYDTQSTSSQKEWHSVQWFGFFKGPLIEMRDKHQSPAGLSEHDLTQYAAGYVNLRDTFWVGHTTLFPPPIK